MRRSLKELDLGLKGELTITSDMEDLSNALFFDQVGKSYFFKSVIVLPYYLGSSSLDQESIWLSEWVICLVCWSSTQNQRAWGMDFRLQSSIISLASWILQSPILLDCYYAEYSQEKWAATWQDVFGLWGYKEIDKGGNSLSPKRWGKCTWLVHGGKISEIKLFKYQTLYFITGSKMGYKSGNYCRIKTKRTLPCNACNFHQSNHTR